MSEELIKRLQERADFEEEMWGDDDDTVAVLREAADALSRSAPVQVPEGWRVEAGDDESVIVSSVEIPLSPLVIFCPREWESWRSTGVVLYKLLRAMLAAAPSAPVAVAQEDKSAEWEAFKRKWCIATMQRHPNPHTRWGLIHAPRWMLVYEDADRGIALFDDRDEAMLQFAKSEQAGWNCTLFVTEQRKPASPSVDAEKVMGLVLRYGQEKQAFGATGDTERGITADELRAQIRAMLTPATCKASLQVAGWIPVGEMLPEKGVAVLAFWPSIWRNHGVQGVTALNNRGRWYNVAEDDSEDDEFAEPTYWQPLPSPPAIANQEARE